MKIYYHGLSPLPMQNIEIHFTIKTLSADGFPKLLQVLLRQIVIKMLTRKYFLALQRSKILSENSVSDVRFYTLVFKFRIAKPEVTHYLDGTDQVMQVRLMTVNLLLTIY